MQINKINRSAINSYNTIKKTKTAGSSAKPSGKFDSVEFDFAQSIESAKANIASRLAAEANIAKIKQLQDEYEGDNCPTSAEEITQAILGE